MYDAIVEQAHAAGMHVIGHVPREINIEHVLEFKQRSIEHLSECARWLLVRGGGTLRGLYSRLMFADADERHMSEICSRSTAPTSTKALAEAAGAQLKVAL